MRARSSVRPAKGTASDNAAAPGCRSRPPWGRLSRPAPGSCGNRQRRHPPHIEDEADEAPFPLRLREPAHRDGAEAEYLLDPPVDRLHDRLAPLEPPSAFVGLQLPTHPLRAGTSAPLGCRALLLPLAERDVGVFFFSSRRRHTSSYGDWSSDVCSSDLAVAGSVIGPEHRRLPVEP